jgi:hypothetical protein
MRDYLRQMGLLRTTPTPHKVEDTRIATLGIEVIYYYEIDIFDCFLLPIDKGYQCAKVYHYIR